MVKRIHEDNTRVVDPQLVLVPAMKRRRITRSVTQRAQANARADVFERIAVPLLASGFLRWHEAENLGRVSKGCREIWKDQRKTYPDWSRLLRELNAMNCTNRCRNCEQSIMLKANRKCCSMSKWNFESAKRTPDFHGVVDLVMSSGVLTWREKGSIRRISKTCYKMHREVCSCRVQDRRTSYIAPYLAHDPRYDNNYEKWTDYRKCMALTKYTEWLIQNLHSYYKFDGITDPSKLPCGLGGRAWFDMQMVVLQRNCPRRYAFVMNMVSLFIAQGELQRSPPTWYANAFLGECHDPVKGETYEARLGAGISEFCLPATDNVLSRFLRTKCYPTKEAQSVLGPLVDRVSIFAPFFDMVPLSPKGKARLPRTLEKLTDEMIDNMSINFFCTVS